MKSWKSWKLKIVEKTVESVEILDLTFEILDLTFEILDLTFEILAFSKINQKLAERKVLWFSKKIYKSLQCLRKRLKLANAAVLPSAREIIGKK